MQSRKTDRSSALDASRAELLSLVDQMRAAGDRLRLQGHRMQRAAKSGRVVARGPISGDRYSLEAWQADSLAILSEEMAELSRDLERAADPGEMLASIQRLVGGEARTLAERRELAVAIRLEKARRRRVVRAQSLARKLWGSDPRSRAGATGNPWHWHRRALLELAQAPGFAEDLTAFDAVAPVPPSLFAVALGVVPPDWWDSAEGETYREHFGWSGVLEAGRQDFAESGRQWISGAAEDLENAARAKAMGRAA